MIFFETIDLIKFDPEIYRKEFIYLIAKLKIYKSIPIKNS